jgi:hypothetical protein
MRNQRDSASPPLRPRASRSSFAYTDRSRASCLVILTLIVTTSCTPEQASLIRQVGENLQVFTIAFMGDSYAAGEGNPIRRLDADGQLWWPNRQCHRSTNNGRTSVADALDDPGRLISIESIDVACSGATIDVGLLGGYRGVPAPGFGFNTLDSQVQQVRDWLDRNRFERLDALVISIGGNDVGFARVVADCMRGDKPDCSSDAELLSWIENGDPGTFESGRQEGVVGFSNLHGRFTNLRSTVTQLINPEKVILVGVPDPLRDENAAFCHQFDDSYGVTQELLPRECTITERVSGSCVGRIRPAGLITSYLNAQAATKNVTRTEAEWVYNNLVARLNTTLEDIAQDFGWEFVAEPLEELTRRHGWCARTRWFNTLRDSALRQGDYAGTAHPNDLGSLAYHHVVLTTLVESLGVRSAPPPVVVADNLPPDQVPVPSSFVLAGKLMPTPHTVQNVTLEVSRNRPSNTAFMDSSFVERLATSTDQRFGFKYDIFSPVVRLDAMCQWVHYRWRIEYTDLLTNERKVVTSEPNFMRATHTRPSADGSVGLAGVCDPVPAT